MPGRCPPTFHTWLVLVKISQLAPLRVVRSAELMPGWWNMECGCQDWFVVASCGHSMLRRRRGAPKRVRCDICHGREL